MIDKSYAKINLCLDVIERYPNGYHNLDMIMLPIDLLDIVSIEFSDEDIFESNIKDLKFDSSNTICKMLDYIRNKYKINKKFKIYLEKNIPMQAGLAGGSSNAASILRCLNIMCNLNLNDKEILEACKYVGADVLFTFYNKPARVKQIGYNLEFFDYNYDLNVLIVKPNTGVCTKQAFNLLDIDKCDHPNVDLILTKFKQNDLNLELKNSLEQSSFTLNKQIEQIKNNLIELGLKNTLMSGSGSSIFSISCDIELLEKVKDLYKDRYFVYVGKILKG